MFDAYLGARIQGIGGTWSSSIARCCVVFGDEVGHRREFVAGGEEVCHAPEKHLQGWRGREYEQERAVDVAFAREVCRLS